MDQNDQARGQQTWAQQSQDVTLGLNGPRESAKAREPERDAKWYVLDQGFKVTGDAAPLYAALATAQAAFGEVKRTRTVKVTPRDSAPYTFNYAPLDEVLAAVTKSLNANGIALLQPLYQEGELWFLRTILAHSSGATLECKASIPWPERRWFDKNAQDWKTAKGSWQDFGSAVTYARRYMMSLLGIAPEEDDDGNAASGNERDTSDRTGPRANTQATPPAAPRQAKAPPQTAEKPKEAPKVEAKPEPAQKPASVPPPGKPLDADKADDAVRTKSTPPPIAHDADGVVAPDLGQALAQEELSPRLQPITDEQNAQALKFFQSKMWPRLNPNTKKVEPVLFESRDVRQQWLREVMGIANPSENLTSKDQMAKVLEALEKLPAKAAS